MSYIASNGYVRVKIPKSHPCSFKNQGWGYEHNVIVYERTGIVPNRDIQVHHINGIKTDNRPCNLSVYENSVHHRLHFLSSNNKRPNEENYEIECACGCGQKIMRYDKFGRPRDRICGHWDNMFEHPVEDKLLELLSNGPMKAKEINKHFGYPVYTQLRYTMNKGLIKRLSHGVYAIVESEREF